MNVAMPSPRRVAAMVLRHVYVLRGSWPRVVELAYWPTMQMVIWGFMTQFLATNSSWVAGAFGVLLAAVLLWDVLFRGQISFSISFLEEMWARNLGNLFVSPLTPLEHVLSMMAMSLIRTVLGLMPAALLAIPLYHYSIFTLGLPLIAFFANLMIFSWAIGLFVTSLILRYGLGAENLAWVVVFALAPMSAVYYPISILPAWLQGAGWALPSTYVFEGMRAVMFRGDFDGGLLAGALALNAVYLVLGMAAYLLAFRRARERGALLQVGE